MHALMAAVLLRMPGLDALDGDAEAEPPDREPGEVEQGIGTGEGNTVIRADGDRQTALGEQPLEGGKRRLLAGGFQRLAQEQEARGVVGDGQRIAISPIAKIELAFEIGAPEIIGRDAR